MEMFKRISAAIALSASFAGPAISQQLTFTVPLDSIYRVVDANASDPARSRVNVKYTGKRPILNQKLQSVTIDFTKCGGNTITNGSCPTLSKPYYNEIKFTLTSPDGRSITIVPENYWDSQIVTSNSRRFAIKFKDGANRLSTPNPSNQEASPVGGELSSLSSVDGEWTLSFSDHTGPDPLSLNSWSLIFAGDPGLLTSDIGGYSTGLASNLEYIKNQNGLLLSYLANNSLSASEVEFDENKKIKLFALGAGAQSTLNGSFYKSTSFNTSYGIAYDLSDAFRIGASYGYGTNALDGTEGDLAVQTSTFIDSTVNTGSLFARYADKSGFQAFGALSYSGFLNDSTRANDISDATASYSGNGYSLATQIAQKITLAKSVSKSKTVYDKLFIRPAVALSYNGYNQDSFTESGEGALDVNYQRSSTLLASIGGELVARLPISSSNTYALRPRIGAEYQANLQGADASSTLSAQSQFDSISTVGVNYGANRGYFSAGLDLLIGNDVAIYSKAGYSKYLSGSDVNYGGGVSFRF